MVIPFGELNIKEPSPSQGLRHHSEAFIAINLLCNESSSRPPSPNLALPQNISYLWAAPQLLKTLILK